MAAIQGAFFGLLLAALTIGFALLAVASQEWEWGGGSGTVIIYCDGWPSIEECIRDGVAPNWRQLKGIEFVGKVE